MHQDAPRGRLLAIGGQEDLENDCVILKEFVRLAKGNQASIVVMTIALQNANPLGKQYTRALKNLGVKKIQVIDVATRPDTHRRQALQALQDATGIFFTGGNALDVTSLIGGTEMERVIRQKHERGTLLAGTSTGAAMLSHAIIIGGDGEMNPRFGDVNIAPGEEFVMGAIIDPHFSQRGRHGRLLSAIAHNPHDLGIGIDEDTAILLDGHRFEVIGAGAVTVIDVGAASHTNVPDVHEGDNLALYDVKLHLLPAGHGFDLDKHTPISGRAAQQEQPDRTEGARQTKRSR